MAGTGPLGVLPPSGGGRGWRAVRSSTEVRGEAAGIAAPPGRGGGARSRRRRGPGKALAAGALRGGRSRGAVLHRRALGPWGCPALLWLLSVLAEVHGWGQRSCVGPGARQECRGCPARGIVWDELLKTTFRAGAFQAPHCKA